MKEQANEKDTTVKRLMTLESLYRSGAAGIPTDYPRVLRRCMRRCELNFSVYETRTRRTKGSDVFCEFRPWLSFVRSLIVFAQVRNLEFNCLAPSIPVPTHQPPGRCQVGHDILRRDGFALADRMAPTIFLSM
jgi:hypothetical protein